MKASKKSSKAGSSGKAMTEPLLSPGEPTSEDSKALSSSRSLGSARNSALANALTVGKPGLVVWQCTLVNPDEKSLSKLTWEMHELAETSHGQFLTSQPYLVLRTELDSKTKLARHDLHIWFGKKRFDSDPTQQFIFCRQLGVNALDNAIVLHRQVERSETRLFRSYFKHGVVYVEDSDQRERLFCVSCNAQHHVTAVEVPPHISSLNQGEVFVFDTGQVIYVYAGDCSDPHEKRQANVLATNLKSAKPFTSRVAAETDDFFWQKLRGKKEDVVLKTVSMLGRRPEAKYAGIEVENVSMYRFSQEAGSSHLTYLKVHQGRVYPKMLRSEDVYILDAGAEVFVWIGAKSKEMEEHKQRWLERADVCLQLCKKPRWISVIRVLEGRPNHPFDSVVYPGRVRRGWLARSIGANEDDTAASVIESAFGSIGEAFHFCAGDRDLEDKIEWEWNLFDRKTIDDIAVTDQQQPQPQTPVPDERPTPDTSLANE